MATRSGSFVDLTPFIEQLPNRMNQLQVVQFQQSYLLSRLLSSDTKVPCYDTVEIPYYVSPPDIGRWITKNGTLPDAVSGQMAMGYESNRYLAIPMSWDLIEQWELEGNPQVLFDRGERMAAEMVWAKWRNIQQSAWTGPGGDTQPMGVATAIEKAAPGSQVEVVHGVDKATEAWNQNGYVQLTQPFGNLGAGTNLPDGVLALQSLIDEATVGTHLPTDLVGPRAAFKMLRRYFHEYSSAHHMVQQKSSAYFGFEVIEFDGVPFTWDHYCPAESIYALHIGEPNKARAQVLGSERNDQELDWEFEQIDRRVFDVEGGMGIISHPNVKDRPIAPRSGYRQLSEAKWLIDSFQMFFKSLNRTAVAGVSGTGTWESWS